MRSSQTIELKRAPALAALEHVTPGMRLGLGTGSTAKLFVDALGEKVKAGLDVVCVPTSLATEQQARALGIPLTTLDDTPALDLTVDGADEIDNRLRLVKGGGGALLREKIVAGASARMIVIADESKRVDVLGRFPLPIEVVRFGAAATALRIERAAEHFGMEGPVRMRMRQAGDGPFLTDGGNLVYDGQFGEIPDPDAFGEALNAIPGVVEHGLFLGMASLALIGTPGGVEEMTR